MQQRAEETKASILETALRFFSRQGFEGVTMRTIEVDAGVQRGAVAYHFENKETLWKRSVDLLVSRMDAHFAPLMASFLDLDRNSRIRAAVAAFVRYSAENPELGRLISKEGAQPSWRLSYIVDLLEPRRRHWIVDIGGMPMDPHLYYFIVGAGSFVFDVEHECREIFDVDPRSDAFIRNHAAMIAEMLIGWADRRGLGDQGVEKN